ncbi:MAG: hypothetical protein QW835_00680 [Candidatus Hadarchaeum sp.]
MRKCFALAMVWVTVWAAIALADEASSLMDIWLKDRGFRKIEERVSPQGNTVRIYRSGKTIVGYTVDNLNRLKSTILTFYDDSDGRFGLTTCYFALRCRMGKLDQTIAMGEDGAYRRGVEFGNLIRSGFHRQKVKTVFDDILVDISNGGDGPLTVIMSPAR